MHKTTSLWVALVVAAASLASCSRSNYAFNNQAAPYAGAEYSQPVAAAQSGLTAPANETNLKPVETALPNVPVIGQPILARAAHSARPALVQRVLLKRITRQLQKTIASPQNVAHAEKTASKAGQYGILALIGAVILVIGGLTNVGFLLTFGTVFFLISLVLLIVHLLKGD